MNYAQRLRKLADSTGLDAFGDEIRAIAHEMDACGSARAQSDSQAGLTLTGATQAEVTDIGIVACAKVAAPMSEIGIEDDDSLRFVQRVLESDAPKEDRQSARDMVVGLRKRVRKAHHGTTAKATQAEVTDEREAFESCTLMEGSLFKRRADDPDKYWDGNVQDAWELWQARAILALRPERVQMTGEQWTDVLGSAGPDLLDLAKQWSDNKVHVYQVVNEAEKIVKAAVLRGITAQAKKEGA